MEVSSVAQAVNLWALKQAMSMGLSQAGAPAQLQIVNQLASLDPTRGQMIDIRI
ncbi:hypothetical protein [Tumebacillus algifaecis]|uniref:hypothetical protein n=1 Tax=Tumebacillus algifaecis TaxID=1214604 RepID=UPI0012FD78BF|nr:hypothetical protein [Tumebacillus algifaecis]